VLFVPLEVLQAFEFTIALWGSTVANESFMKFPVGCEVIARDFFAGRDVS